MGLSWPKHGTQMVLKMCSSWILINLPRDAICQISHCWAYPVAQFPRNGQDMAIHDPLCPKHGPHMVLQIGSSWILINVPRDVLCQISHCWVYTVVPFPGNGQKMALLWSKHGPHMVLQIGSFWILIIVPKAVPCKSTNCWVYPVAPFPRRGQNMALYG